MTTISFRSIIKRRLASGDNALARELLYKALACYYNNDVDNAKGYLWLINMFYFTGQWGPWKIER